MSYFNYHAKAKRLIKDGHLMSVSLFMRYKHITPAMVLYFENNIPIPIRDYMWKDYLPLIEHANIKINNPDNIDLNEFASID